MRSACMPTIQVTQARRVRVFVPAYQAICTLPKYFFRHDLTVGLGSLKFTPAPPETTARPKGHTALVKTPASPDSAKADPGPARDRPALEDREFFDK